MPTLNEVRAAKAKLDEELEKNPDLRYDDNWKQRWDSVKKMYSEVNKQEKTGA